MTEPLQPAEWEVPKAISDEEQALIDKLHHELSSPGVRDALETRIAALKKTLAEAEAHLATVPVVGQPAAEVVADVETTVEADLRKEAPVVEKAVEGEAKKLLKKVEAEGEKLVEEVVEGKSKASKAKK